MNEPPNTSRTERILHEDMEDFKPPAIQRKYTVNPQEANAVLAQMQRQPLPKSPTSSHTIHHQMKAPPPGPAAERSATRGAVTRLALEEKFDDDTDGRPVHAPERKYTIGNPLSALPPTTSPKIPPGAAGDPRSRSFTSCSNSSGSSNVAPVPLSLTYNETVHISNTTGPTTTTSVMPSGNMGGHGATPPALMMKPPPNYSRLPSPSKPPHPWMALQLQQGYELTAVESSSLEDDKSSLSNSFRTRSTIDTLELVLAQRYPNYGEPSSSSEYFYDEDDDHNGDTGITPHHIPLHEHHPRDITTTQMQRRRDGAGYSESAVQLLLDEKRRQAGGYISNELDAYVNSNNNYKDGQPFAKTSSPTAEWTNVNAHHNNTFAFGGYSRETSDNDGDTSLSTAPDPPSLRVREHVALRPGAYRMSHGGVARHVDNDSVVSSSLRTHSTLRTNLGLGIIEASLVVDEPLPKDEDDYYNEDRVAAMSYDHDYIQNYCRTHNYHHDYECASSDLFVDDSECPSPPPPLNYEMSTGEVTFFSATTTSSPIVEARPFDESHAVRAFFRSWKVRCTMCCLTLVFVTLALGTVYAVTGFVFDNAGGSNGNGNGDGGAESDKNSSLIFATEEDVLTLFPSSAPTTLGDLHLEYFVDVALPDYTRVALTDPNSAQSLALNWLRNNTNLDMYSETRRLQRFALATLFFATGGLRRWYNNKGWLSDLDECSWYSAIADGLKDHVCTSDEYRILSLHGNELRGTLPPEIELLSSLVLIRLDDNILTGFLPATLGHLTNLNELHLFDNAISGTIPLELGSMSQLKVLNLENNFLAQTLPSSLGQLESLRMLFLDRNILVGTIPTSLGMLCNLETLYLYGNYLTGTIPSEFGGMTNMTDFQLEFNQLYGSIPPEISSWTQVDTLNLGNNTLTGSIPTEIGNMTELIYMDLFLNHLQGQVPSEVGRLTNLNWLYLERNNFVGELPTEIGNLVNVTVFWLHTNNMTGTIPTQIGQLTGLEDLDLSENTFSGSLPTEIGLLTNLQSLSLYSNLLTGAIPSELGLLTNARSIQLDGNGFLGTMPFEVCDLVYKNYIPYQNLTVDCVLVQCFCCACFR